MRYCGPTLERLPTGETVISDLRENEVFTISDFLINDVLGWSDEGYFYPYTIEILERVDQLSWSAVLRNGAE